MIKFWAEMKLMIIIISFLLLAGLSQASNSLSLAYAFPVPYQPSLGHSQITFTNLASQCTIRVFNLSGNQVVALQETDGDGQYNWDAKNQAGETLAAGMYLYHIKAAADSAVGKILIVK